MAPRLPTADQRGVTLAEMLVTVALLALVASLAIPSASPASTFAADAVAGEVAGAVRFAQREAIRTGAWHVAAVDIATQSLRVYRPTSAGAGNEDLSKPVIHPIDKTSYKVSFGTQAGARGQLVSAAFAYGAGATANYVGFSPQGQPADRENLALPSGVNALKGNGTVLVRHGNVSRTVVVDPVTGRVSIQ